VTWHPEQDVTEETTTSISFLSGSTLVLVLALALVAFYVGRALWIARREWPECRTDTKVLYLLVAPPLTLAVDLLTVTDRIFWSTASTKKHVPRSRTAARGFNQSWPRTALRSDN
jgi:hypothetical protein